ncbi:otoferlin-like [Macrosteles quadrilineatus]|uniref:otoferlin-like n=1 Tax=Macrosteles quadrilineatus TaxID=74068 RepID=UPI0023E16EE4|nr:otoferlin-like [Macrosteles quadrilineatus]
MSLTLRLKQFQVAKCKGEKLAKVVFRGVSHTSKGLEDKVELIPVDQRFEWPVARAIESHEQLQVQLLVRSRYLGPDKLLGSYTLVLQKLVQGCNSMLCSRGSSGPLHEL